MNFYALIPLTTFVLNLFIWTLIFAGKKNRINFSFLIFIALIMTWQLCSFLSWIFVNDEFIRLMIKIETPISLSLGYAFLYFIYTIIDKKKDFIFHLFFIFVLSVIPLSSFTELIISGYKKQIWGTLFIPGKLYYFVIGTVLFSPIIYSVCLLNREIKKTAAQNRKEALQLLLIGSLLITFFGTVTNIIIPYHLGLNSIAALASSGSVIFSFFMYMSIKKYDILTISIEEVAADVLDNIIDGVIIKNRNNEIVQYNKAAAMMLDLTTSPHDSNVDSLTILRMSGDFTNFIFKCKNGRIFSITQSVVGEKTRKKGKIQLIRDITDQKTAENILKISNEKLDSEVKKRVAELENAKTYIESIFNSIPISIIIIDIRGRIKKGNNNFFNLFGYTEDELFGKTILRIAPKHHRKNLNRLLSKIDKERKVNLELMGLQKNGTEFPVLINITSMDNVNKEPLIIASILDIRERKKAEKDLKFNEMQFRTFIDQASDFILIKDKDGRYLRVNQKFCSLIGMSEEEISGKTPHELGYSQEFIESIAVIDNKVVNNKEVVISEHKAGKAKKINVEWLEHTNFPIIDDEGKVQYIGVISRDITNVKKAAKELSDKNKQLKYAYEQLQKSYDLIIKQEKLASLGTMVAGMAHEINNPAQAIRFSMQGLKMNISDIKNYLYDLNNLIELEKDLNISCKNNILNLMEKYGINLAVNELKNTAEENLNSLDRIDRIVNSTKRMAYKDSGFGICDINKIINDGVVLVQNQIVKFAKMDLDLADNIPCFQGLEQELGQVLMNLAINAKDAIVEKGLSVKSGLIVICSKYDSNKGQIIVRVQDNGTGIPKENLQNIFDPFFSTKTIGKGTGLGLNICYRIIKAHKGNIDVKTHLGEGTEFIITLPFAKEE